MQKTIYLLMLTMIISGVFTGCNSEVVPVEQPVEDTVVENTMPIMDADFPPVKEMVVVENNGMMDRKMDGEMMEINHYSDGTYEEIGAYQSPAGAETLGVKVTIKDDVVTSLVVTNRATHEVSLKLQNMFIQGINTLVLGKRLEDLDDFTVVNGSSLTPKGFNSAIKSIKVDAENAS